MIKGEQQQNTAGRSAEKQLRGQLARARKALSVGRYDEANAACERAMALVFEASLLHHCAQVEQLQDQVLEWRTTEAQIDQVLQRVAAWEAEGAVPKAVAALNALLAELSRLNLAEMGRSAAKKRDQLWATQPLSDNITEARTLFRDQDFDAAHRLIEILHAEQPANNEVVLWHNRVNRQRDYLQGLLQEAQQKIAASAIEDAVAILAGLRASWPHNPNLSRLWYRTYWDLGVARSEAGRKLLLADDPQEAVEAFSAAIEAFRSALEVADSRPGIRRALDQSLALLQFAIQATQASEDQRARRWDQAHQALLTAGLAYEEARKASGNDLRDVGFVLDRQLQQVDQAIAAVVAARQLLSEGQQLLDQGDYDRAQEAFQQGYQLAEPYEEELAFVLFEGQQRAEAGQREIAALLEQARASSDVLKRLHILREGSARWPSASEITSLLAETVLGQAMRAVGEGHDADAIAWAHQALDLPESVLDATARAQAASVISQMEAKRDTEAWLREADALQAQLDQAPLPTATDYQSLVEILDSARQEAARYPQYLPVVEARLQDAQDRMRLLAQVDARVKEAEGLRERGQWAEAAAELGKALEILADAGSEELARRQAAWQEVAATLSSAMDAATATIASAEALYAATREDVAVQSLPALAVRWSDIEQVLTSARNALAAPPAAAEALPAAWPAASAQAERLAVRCQTLQGAVADAQSGHIDETLQRLALAMQEDPSDSVLADLHSRLLGDARRMAQEQAELFIATAVEHINNGEWLDAQRCLSEASQLQLAAETTSSARRAVERRILLWDGINRLHEAGLEGDREGLRRLLAAAADADSGLSDETRSMLNGLLGLENAPLHDEAYQERGRGLCAGLADAAVQHRLVQHYVLDPARSWFSLISQQAHEGFIADQLALGDYLLAYKTARMAIERHPSSPRFVAQAAEVRQRVQHYIENGLEAQIARARELYQQGAYAEALVLIEQPDAMMSSLQQEVEADFPELIREDARLSELHSLRDDLRRTLLDMQAVTDNLSALVGEAHGLFASGRLDEAKHVLDQARLMDQPQRAAAAWRQWQALQDAIEADQRAAAQDKVRTALINAENALGLSRAAADVRQVVADLLAVRPVAAQFAGSQELDLRQHLDQLIEQAQQLLAQLEDASNAYQTAVQAGAQHDLQRQLSALERAERTARGEELEKIRAEIDHLRPAVARQGQMQAAWDQALIALNRDDFATAYEQLAMAQHWGQAEELLQEYRIVAQAGLLLREAQDLAVADAELAQEHLSRVLSMTEACPPAARLHAEARNVLNRLEANTQRRLAADEARQQALSRQQQEAEMQRAQIVRLIHDAQSALRLNRLDEAERSLQEIFALVPEQAEALELRDRLDRASQAEALLARAQNLHRQSEYDAALQLVDTILALYPDSIGAKELSARLVSERVVGAALARVFRLAEDQRFAEARAALHAASEKNAAHPQLVAAAERLQALEERYWESMLQMAEDALARSDFRSALQAYAELQDRLDPADAQIRLAPLQHAAVEQWAQWVGDQATAALQSRDARSGDLLALQGRLQEVLEAPTRPTESSAQALRKLAHSLTGERLRRRLAEGYDALQQGDYRQAEAIGLELEETTTGGDWPQLDFQVVTFNEDVRRMASSPEKEAAPTVSQEAPDQAGLEDDTVEAVFRRFEDLLGRWNLDEAAQLLASAQHAHPDEERWQAAEQALLSQRVQIQQQQEMFRSGWQHLDRREFQAAAGAFASIAGQPGQIEAQRWSDFVVILDEGINLALALDDETALERLSTAENILRARPDGADVVWWQDQLLAERRRAVYYASLLRAEIEGIIADRRIKDRMKTENDNVAAVAMLRKLIQRQESLPAMVQAAAEPPADFEIAFV